MDIYTSSASYHKISNKMKIFYIFHLNSIVTKYRASENTCIHSGHHFQQVEVFLCFFHAGHRFFSFLFGVCSMHFSLSNSKGCDAQQLETLLYHSRLSLPSVQCEYSMIVTLSSLSLPTNNRLSLETQTL